MEVNVAESKTVEQIVSECNNYWTRTRVPQQTVVEMKAELESHLQEAAAAGKPPESVVGGSVTDFAEAWASEYRIPPPPNPPLSPEARRKLRKKDVWTAWGWLVPVAVVVLLLITIGPKEDGVDDPNTWQWIWLGMALLLAVGEMLTAGFFMLPFAVGAAVAAVLAFFDVAVPVQFLTFLGTSVLALVALRRFAASDHEPSYPVGAKRYVGAAALVLEDIDPVLGVGRVKLDAEEWNATTNGEQIPAGVKVTVVQVRGPRLVVEVAGPGPDQIDL
jgi:membrane protein implicated in regulation of membrane protease activity